MNFQTAILLCLSLFLIVTPATAEEPLEVCATVPSLGNLVEEVGGPDVNVTVFSRGSEDAHFVEPRPSFIRKLHDADLLVLVGLEMETGWLPSLMRNARNTSIAVGAPGYLDASIVIQPLEVPQGPVDRSMGDVHALGNPHYILDPVEGLRVAQLIRDRLAQLRPEQKDEFGTRFTNFRRRLAVRLVGETVVREHGAAVAVKLALLQEKGRLREFLDQQDLAIEGWLGSVLAMSTTRAVADHSLWPYFCRRFGFEVIALLEPKPGIPPTTGHLRQVIEQMQAEEIRLVFASAYFDPRFSRFVSDKAGAKVLAMAHEVEALSGVDDYLSLIDHNVNTLVASHSETEQ